MPSNGYQSAGITRQEGLSECVWDEIREAGAYVERGTGDLYRIPGKAMTSGGSLIILKQSSEPPRMVRVSKDPFVTSQQARLYCARHNIAPNF